LLSGCAVRNNHNIGFKKYPQAMLNELKVMFEERGADKVVMEKKDFQRVVVPALALNSAQVKQAKFVRNHMCFHEFVTWYSQRKAPVSAPV
jgi:hypothetical protein